MDPPTSTSSENLTEHVSDPESDSGPDESLFIPLAKIPTIRELYKISAIKPSVSDQIQYKPNASLLDRISLFQGDITRLKVDSIVNAANKSLLGGGGVDGAIHFAAGRQLLEECRKLNGCATGQSKITRGYNLPSRHVIHTVGPVYTSSEAKENAELLASCYKTSLEVAIENDARHIAFPSVSTGVYGYPIVDATRIALDEVRRFCDAEIDKKLDRVIFVVWSNKDKAVYESLIPEYFPSTPEEQKLDNPPEPDL